MTKLKQKVYDADFKLQVVVMEQGTKRPDWPKAAHAEVRAVVEEAGRAIALQLLALRASCPPVEVRVKIFYAALFPSCFVLAHGNVGCLHLLDRATAAPD